MTVNIDAQENASNDYWLNRFRESQAKGRKTMEKYGLMPKPKVVSSTPKEQVPNGMYICPICTEKFGKTKRHKHNSKIGIEHSITPNNKDIKMIHDINEHLSYITKEYDDELSKAYVEEVSKVFLRLNSKRVIRATEHITTNPLYETESTSMKQPCKTKIKYGRKTLYNPNKKAVSPKKNSAKKPTKKLEQWW